MVVWLIIFALNKINNHDKTIAISTNIINNKIINNKEFKIHEYIYNIICKFINVEGQKKSR